MATVETVMEKLDPSHPFGGATVQASDGKQQHARFVLSSLGNADVAILGRVMETVASRMSGLSTITAVGTGPER